MIGEAVVSRNGGQDFQLEYVAGPGVPLMRLRESGAAGSAEGVFARGGWQGVPSQAQGRIASWMSLREVFAAVEASGAASHANVSAPNGAWHAQADLSAQGKPRRIAVDYPQTHERFVFVFGGK